MELLLPKSRLKHIKEQCFQTLFLYIQSLCWWKTALDDALWYGLCISSQNAHCDIKICKAYHNLTYMCGLWTDQVNDVIIW